MAELLEHLHRAAAEPFARPHADCCSFAADWVLARTGVDPAADLRGAYADERGALRLIRRWGGFDLMWKVHMAMAGFNETRAPHEGDVGVVRDGSGRMVSAIRVHGGWAAKAADGLIIEDFPMIVAWSLRRG